MAQEIDFTILDTFFHISPQGAEHPVFEMPATAFLDKERSRSALLLGGELVQATGMELAASFVGMSFFNLCVAKLIVAAQCNRLLDLPLTELTFQLEPHDDHAHLGFKLRELNSAALPEDGPARKRLLLDDLTAYFQEELNEAIETVAASADVKSAMIWNQFGGQIHAIRDYLPLYEQRQDVLERFERDFAMLKELPPEVFNRKRNPFIHKPRYIDDPWSPPEGKMLLRSSCCMYDCRVDGEKCYNCPRMLPEEREERRQEVLAASQS
ncbi:(2Fe-2S)-binding protein [Paenibacillus arenilitoris]|uniref:Ferric siderophore reductase C-terminal domain-containing protein n=1 Tax=Paenibacillus arenilitoris TaxID=2772299 RepID=A0A927H6Q2_9BACL|nr:(2Fe-2S)-binding protein [Paenibacillus arenilitoris]MBD2869732.1 hypothetical protein [Paenibacillus arenilitoris]